MRLLLPLLVLIIIGLAPNGQAMAQTPPNCALTTQTNPDHTVLKCAGGLIIEIEAAADLGLVSVQNDGSARVIEVNSGAVLVNVEAGSGDTQIKTPHAIAAVRGTLYAVDVAADSTAVFVVRGQVAVRAASDAADQVILGPGEGVDVSAGAPLVVKTWGETRVVKLMTRFGR